MNQTVSPKGRIPFKLPRRLSQLIVLLAITILPWLAQNPTERAPSRIVLGQLAEPVLVDVSGDTWSFSLYDFNLTHPLAFIENVVAAKLIYVPTAFAVLIPLGITLLGGRIFCSWMCPVGFLLELNTIIAGRVRWKSKRFSPRLPDIRFSLLTAGLFFVFLLGIPLFTLIDPPHALGLEMMSLAAHQQLSLWGTALLLALLLADTFVGKRACCSKLCPSGAALSLLGRKRVLYIKIKSQNCVQCGECDKACPYDLTPMELKTSTRFDWSTCDNCGLCVDSCPHDALCLRIGKSSDKE